MARLVIAVFAVVFLGALALVWLVPTDRDHAAVTTPEFLAGYADPPGKGVLDGVRFDTRMGPPSNPDEIDDFVQFDRGLFMSRECTDRCNYPPSAYLTRETPDGTAFIVEAFCPTKKTTMVWRGMIKADRITAKVTWTSKRLLMSTTTVLDVTGTRSPLTAQFDEK